MKRTMKIAVLGVLILSFIFSITGCKNDNINPIVTMEIQGFGTIEIELYPDVAPNTVNNYISLIQSGYYDGLTFHRVAKGFVIQGGDPNGNGSGGPGYTIKGEFSSNGFDNYLKHTKGVISMARNMASKDSAGSQFFIMLEDEPDLDGDYATFGKVIKGMDIVQKVGKVEVEGQTPKARIVISKVTVDTKGVKYPEPDKID